MVQRTYSITYREGKMSEKQAKMKRYMKTLKKEQAVLMMNELVNAPFRVRWDFCMRVLFNRKSKKNLAKYRKRK